MYVEWVVEVKSSSLELHDLPTTHERPHSLSHHSPGARKEKPQAELDNVVLLKSSASHKHRLLVYSWLSPNGTLVRPGCIYQLYLFLPCLPYPIRGYAVDLSLGECLAMEDHPGCSVCDHCRVTTGAEGAAERMGNALKSRGEKTKAIWGLTWVSLYLVQPLPQYGNTGDIRLPWLHQKRNKKNINQRRVCSMDVQSFSFFSLAALWCGDRRVWGLVTDSCLWTLNLLWHLKVSRKSPLLFTFVGIRSFLNVPNCQSSLVHFQGTALNLVVL